MKSFYIPAAVLILILSLAIRTGSYVRQSTEEWISQIEQIAGRMQAEDWDAALTHLERTQQDWLHQAAGYHTIMEHQELDEAEKLFSGALAACREQDPVELRIHLEQLITQLEFLAETQQISWQNIL